MVFEYIKFEIGFQNRIFKREFEIDFENRISKIVLQWNLNSNIIEREFDYRNSKGIQI